MKRKFFECKTSTIVAIALGAAVYMLLCMYVKIPTGVPNTNIHTSYGFLSMMSILFGPMAGGVMALIGNAMSGVLSSGSVWWSWVIAAGVAGFLYGLPFRSIPVREGIFNTKHIVKFNVFQILANVVAWVVVAPLLDVVMYAEPVTLSITQGATAGLTNSISAGVIGTLLLLAYSKSRSRKGSLTKEN